MRRARASDPRFAWRFALLFGLAAGLAASPWLPAQTRSGATAAGAFVAATVVALLAIGPRAAGGLAWLCLLGAGSALAGAAVGCARLDAIDAGALHAQTGTATVT